MNVTQELSDQELYNYDVLVKLLGDRLTQHPEYLLPGLDSTAGRDAIMRTRTPTLTLLLSYADWDIHRAHRNSVRNSSVSSSSGDSLTPN